MNREQLLLSRIELIGWVFYPVFPENMHFVILVIVPNKVVDSASSPGKSIKSYIEKVMSPYQRTGSNEEGWWDFFVIGGRWNGLLTEIQQEVSDPYHDNPENNTITVAKWMHTYAEASEDDKKAMRSYRVVDAEGRIQPPVAKLAEEKASSTFTFEEAVIAQTMAHMVRQPFSSEQFTALFDKHKNDFVVNIDCHW